MGTHQLKKTITIPSPIIKVILITALICTSACSSKGKASSAKSATTSSTNAQSLAPLSLDTPLSNPYHSNSPDLTISGSCTEGATVYLTGADTKNTQCFGSSFSFTVNPSGNGTYAYALVQKANNYADSIPVAFSWLKDNTLPLTPVPTIPNKYSSNSNSLVINGSCTDGNTVELSGDVSASDVSSPSNSLTQICSNSTFSFTVNKTNDGTYKFVILQTDPANVSSGAIGVNWILDTIAPSAPVITNPASSPKIDNGSTLAISGTCENKTSVTLSNSASDSMNCTNGAFNFNVNKTSDGNYTFEVRQTDAAGNSSAPAIATWERDTTNPSAPVPSSSHYYSNVPSSTITGTCESGSTIKIFGASTGSTTCNSGTFSIIITQANEGLFNYTLSQTDIAGNESTDASIVYERDSTAPPAPLVTNPNPVIDPYLSSDNTVTISGICETGATITLGGDGTGTTTCNSGGFTINANQTTDATYHFTLTQTDLASNTSASTTVNSVKNSNVPNTPVISNPSSSTVYSKLNTLTIEGSCDGTNTVELSGEANNSVTCASNTFSFNVSQTTDGSYTYNIKQKSPSNIYSGAASVTWVRDTLAPGNPTITSPANSPFHSNGDSISISGGCSAGNTVDLGSDGSATTTCSANNSFSFTVSKSTDQSYNFTVSQTDPAGNTSGSASTTWIRDTVAPAVVIVTNPNANPFTSGDNSITVSGTCEIGATLSITGTATGSPVCADGTFSFDISKIADGTYNTAIDQSDSAGNKSSSMNFTWIRQATIASTPVITTPATNSVNSNTSTFTITATCDDTLSPSKAIVNLGGDITAAEVTSPVGSLSQNCTTSPVTFIVQKNTEGTFNFTVNQSNPNNYTISANASLTWNRDTTPPSAPTISNPNTSPFTAPGSLNISGVCELGTTVNLSGASTDSISCSQSGTYSFTLNKSDGTYTFNLTQSDIAGNTSASVSQTWVRNSASLSTPTITSPATSPISNSASTLTITGACTNGYTVTLGGNIVASDVTSPSNSLTQTCSSNTYSFTIAKSVDGSFNFTVKQTYNGVDSSSASLVWNKDATAPTVTINTKPTNPNYTSNGSFTFSSNEAGATFQCKLDTDSNFSSCTSPYTFASATNGSRTFSIKATDSAGNTSTVATYTWSQANYNTIALYHLNTATYANDSSLYSTLVTNTLAEGNSSAPTNAETSTGVIGGAARQFSTASTVLKYLYANHNNALNLGSSKLTIEMKVKWTALTTNSGSYYTLASKSDGTKGWEVRLRRSSTMMWFIDFVACVNGTSLTYVSSSVFDAAGTGYTGTWQKLTITFNQGNVAFFMGNSTGAPSAMGTATLGTAGAASITMSSTAPLRLAANSTTATSGSSIALLGSLDEVRISQIIRTPSTMTSEFTAD